MNDGRDTSDQKSALKAQKNSVARVFAFYLPQFHQIPENDEWWGPGFTEWTNVRRARPLFKGHAQPRVPGLLGYYDLTNASVRAKQAVLAQTHGVEAFCYWHYWFGGGKRILELPFNEVVKSGEPNMPFCLAWANQTWTGVWHGAPNRVLVKQTYPGAEDEREHFSTLLPAFRDPRYATVDGKPIFLVYSPSDLPDPKSFVEHWRHLAISAGFPGLYMVGMSNNIYHPSLQFFDKRMEFGPGDFLDRQPPPSFLRRVVRIIASKYLSGILSTSILCRLRLPAIYNYSSVVKNAFSSYSNVDDYIPCVLSGWDNTPRSGRRGVVFENFTPESFREYLRKALSQVGTRRPEERLVFIKAWNEWAEGNYLEPDTDTERDLLAVIKHELEEEGRPS